MGDQPHLPLLLSLVGLGHPQQLQEKRVQSRMGARMTTPGLYPQADGGQEWEHPGDGLGLLAPNWAPRKKKLPCTPRVSYWGLGAQGGGPDPRNTSCPS